MKACAILIAGLALCASSAKADTAYNFNAVGSGITTSGSIAVSLVSGQYEITGITGVFSDTVGTPFSGTITGLLPSSYNATTSSVSPDGIIFYDNLFYPAGSPAACDGASASTSNLDGCGLAFYVTAGGTTYEANLYGALDSSGYEALDILGGVLEQGNVPVTATFVAVTPEPSTWLLTATGVMAVGGEMKRRLNAHKV